MVRRPIPPRGRYRGPVVMRGGAPGRHVVGRRWSMVPHGARRFVYRDLPYFHDGPLFWRQDAAGYVVVEPEIGMIVPMLPPGCLEVWVDGRRYYVLDGIYYAPVVGGYEIVATPWDGGLSD